MTKTIPIACTGAGTLDLDQLEDYQGGLKKLSEDSYGKLREQILKTGFSEPYAVWRHEGHHYLLNGHQRKLTLTRLRDREGYVIPPLPVSWVEAQDHREAKWKLLSLTSQYGQIQEQGLRDFLADSGITLEEVQAGFHFPEIDLDKMMASLGGQGEGPPEIEFSEELMESRNYIVLTFDNDIDWLAAQTHFNLKSVHSRRANGKSWSKGVGRVVDGASYLAKVNGDGI